MYVALPHQVNTKLPRANFGSCQAKSERLFVPREGDFGCCAKRLRALRGCCGVPVFFHGKMEKEKCLALIRLYKSKEVLWNSKGTNYHNKSIREEAWKDVGDEMKMPVQDLKKKMTTLLASYRKEKSRIKKSHITGSAAGTVYVSKWFAFNEFDFMADKNTPDDTVDTLPDEPGTSHSSETSGFENENEELAVERITPSRTPEAPRHKRPCIDPKSASTRAKQENQAMLLEAFDILKSSVITPTDPYFTYGQHIANELRKYDPSTLAQVKHAINNVIFEADMGEYSYGYYTQNYSQSRRSESIIRTPTPAMSPASTPTPSPASVQSSAI